MLVGTIPFVVVAIDGVDEYDCDPTETCHSWMLPVGLTGIVVMKVWSIVDAAAGARQWNQRHGLAGFTVRPTLAIVPLERGPLGLALLSGSF